jgi:hypothetical protein
LRGRGSSTWRSEEASLSALTRQDAQVHPRGRGQVTLRATRHITGTTPLSHSCRAEPTQKGVEDRTTGPRPPPQSADRAKVTCFNCRQVGHKSFECLQQVQPGGQNRSSQFQTPAKPPAQGGQPPRTQQKTAQPPATRGRLNHLTAKDVAAAPDVALGEFLVDSVLAIVLFDTGAQFSYISNKFVRERSLPTKPRPRPILTSSPLGEKRITLECRG